MRALLLRSIFALTLIASAVPACSSSSDGGDDADAVGTTDTSVTPDAGNEDAATPGADASPDADAGADGEVLIDVALDTDDDASEDAGPDASPDAGDDADDDASDDASDDTGSDSGLDAFCGDLVCDPDEDCDSCAVDCGACPATCGDDVCEEGEDCESCDVDCGVCEANEAPGFVLLPAGTYVMGSPEVEEGRWEQEVAHTVTLTRPILAASTEVTQELWAALMGNNPSYVDACGDNCPVEFVNWFEALAFANAQSRVFGFPACYALSECDTVPGNGMVCDEVAVTASSGNPQDCSGYRLPTEAEWEYLARGGRGEAWPCGNDATCVRRLAWYEENSSARTHQVNSLQPNNFGLYDTHGNVWEWVWDGYISNLGTDAVTDPVVAPDTFERTIRGGSWINTIRATRSSTRIGLEPSTRNGHVGFRLVRTAEP